MAPALLSKGPGERRDAMTRWMSLSALGLASILLGPVATANASADGVSEFDHAQVPAPGSDSSSETDAIGPTVEGEVAAIDHVTGALVLDTDEGLLRLVTSPDELRGLEVGDVVRVSFVDDVSY
jgi:hypothetical protein